MSKSMIAREVEEMVSQHKANAAALNERDMNTMKLYSIRLWFTAPTTTPKGRPGKPREHIMDVAAMGAHASDALDRAFAKMRAKFPGAELRVMADGLDPWLVLEVEDGAAVIG